MLVFYVAIGVICIGPRSLDRDIDVYIDAPGAENPQQLSSAIARFAGNAENFESTEISDQVGLACSGIDSDSEQQDPVDKTKKVRGLTLRSLVVWITFAGLFQFLAWVNIGKNIADA